MKSTGIAIAALSVILSAGVSLAVCTFELHRTHDVNRVKRIELIDSSGAVRASLGIVRIEGRDQPQFKLQDEHGVPSVAITINERSEGTLYFNSPETEGKVSIGYLSGSDVALGHGGYATDEKDTTGAWGLSVMGPRLAVTGVGYSNAGTPFTPRSASTGVNKQSPEFISK